MNDFRELHPGGAIYTASGGGQEIKQKIDDSQGFSVGMMAGFCEDRTIVDEPCIGRCGRVQTLSSRILTYTQHNKKNQVAYGREEQYYELRSRTY
jgi:hypothetical protein